MDSINMSTERVRHLLREVREKKLEYRICTARDIIGPGGGIYITAYAELDEKHLAWLERRNPISGSDTYLDVILYRGTAPSGRAVAARIPEDLDIAGEIDDETGEARRRRAEESSAAVGEKADAVAHQAERLYQSIEKADFSIADLRQGRIEEGLREFERRIRAFHGAVKKAIDEYMNGNTLVMDLIVKFGLDRKTVRHALNVAAFATEMAAQLMHGERERSGSLEQYLGDLSREELYRQMGEPEPEGEVDVEELEERRIELCKRELVEIFLGGFMHDCGLWNEPFCLEEGHEVMGAKLIWELQEIQNYAPSLVKIVLFHSDINRLADRYGVVKVIEDPDDPERISFKREFFYTEEDARTAIEMRPGNFLARILSDEDLRKVIPVALAERYITQTQDFNGKRRWEVINDLARYVKGGLFMRYVVALCNAQIEVIAPRRAYVKLEGTVTITVEDRKNGRRARRLDVTDFEAASLNHSGDRNSPHLIVLFVRHSDGHRSKAEYVAAQDPALWERGAGASSRMYIPVGRYRNNLDIRVTGFISDEVYERILKEYEEEFKLRLA